MCSARFVAQPDAQRVLRAARKKKDLMKIREQADINSGMYDVCVFSWPGVTSDVGWLNDGGGESRRVEAAVTHQSDVPSDSECRDDVLGAGY